jgi:hypothetical protein
MSLGFRSFSLLCILILILGYKMENMEFGESDNFQLPYDRFISI